MSSHKFYPYAGKTFLLCKNFIDWEIKKTFQGINLSSQSLRREQGNFKNTKGPLFRVVGNPSNGGRVQRKRARGRVGKDYSGEKPLHLGK